MLSPGKFSGVDGTSDDAPDDVASGDDEESDDAGDDDEEASAVAGAGKLGFLQAFFFSKPI